MTWKPGESGNPNGKATRPFNSRKYLSQKFIRTLAHKWEKHGDAVLERLIRDDPATFVKVVASLIPKDVKLETDGPLIVNIVRHVYEEDEGVTIEHESPALEHDDDPHSARSH